MLPPPPTAAQIDIVWLLDNKETLAAYMAAVYALSNLEAVVKFRGKTAPGATVKLAAGRAVLEITVPNVPDTP